MVLLFIVQYILISFGLINTTGGHGCAKKIMDKVHEFGKLEESWRRGRDSNPRYAINVYTISSRALSTTQTPLRIKKNTTTVGSYVSRQLVYCQLTVVSLIFFLEYK